MRQGEPTKKEIRRLREQLEYKAHLVWDAISAAEKKRVFTLSRAYKEFLDRAKTEREAVTVIRETALGRGFAEKPEPGSHQPFFRVFHNKSLALVRPGKGALAAVCLRFPGGHDCNDLVGIRIGRGNCRWRQILSPVRLGYSPNRPSSVDSCRQELLRIRQNAENSGQPRHT